MWLDFLYMLAAAKALKQSEPNSIKLIRIINFTNHQYLNFILINSINDEQVKEWKN